MCAQVAEDEKGKGKQTMFDQAQPEAMRYLQRVVDEVLAVLFDNRRQSCHGLVLNNFVSCSGFKQLLAQFQVACQMLFGAVDRQEAEPETDATIAKGMSMSICSPCCGHLVQIVIAKHWHSRMSPCVAVSQQVCFEVCDTLIMPITQPSVISI